MFVESCAYARRSEKEEGGEDGNDATKICAEHIFDQDGR